MFTSMRPSGRLKKFPKVSSMKVRDLLVWLVLPYPIINYKCRSHAWLGLLSKGNKGPKGELPIFIRWPPCCDKVHPQRLLQDWCVLCKQHLFPSSGSNWLDMAVTLPLYSISRGWLGCSVEMINWECPQSKKKNSSKSILSPHRLPTLKHEGMPWFRWSNWLQTGYIQGYISGPAWASHDP